MLDLLSELSIYRLRDSKIEAKHLKDIDSFIKFYNANVGNEYSHVSLISYLKIIVDDLIEIKVVIKSKEETVTGLPFVSKNQKYEPNFEYDFQSRVSIKYIQTRQNAIRRNKEFSLKLADVERLMKRKTCYYSGIRFTEKGDNSLTFDRIDATKGYTKENTVACCFKINQLKNWLLEKKVMTESMTNYQLKKMLVSFSELL